MKAERRDVDGMHFIRVSGTTGERARSHAELLKAEILDGALPKLARKNEMLIRRGPGIVRKKPVQDTVVWFYKNVIIPMLDRNSDAEIRSVVSAISDVTGMKYEDVRESLFQADGLMLLSRTSMMKYLLAELPSGGLPGCTSSVVMKDWTKDGRLLACRNQDYPMVGPWERHSTLVFNEPTEKGQIPHVSLTTAGVHTAGLTSMNRAGLTIAVHAHFGRSVSFRGKTVIGLANEIIREATTIGEAVDMARRSRRHANWAYVISSAKEQDAVVIEMTPTKTAVRHAQDGFLAHSNFFHDQALQSEEALLSGGCCEDLAARLCRPRQILEELRGKIGPEHLVKVLGDHIDPQTGEERVVGNTVGVVTTIKSCVFDPGAQKMWISARGQSPMGLDADYLEVDVERFWDEASRTKPLNRLHGYVPRNPRLVEGVKHYREAYRAWHMESDQPDFEQKAMVHLRKAVAAFPEDGNLWVQCGIVAFHLHEFTEARRYFEEALSRKLTEHTGLVAKLFLARSLDVLGEREKALEIYHLHVNAKAEPKISKEFKRGLKRAYRQSQTGAMQIDLQFPDMFHY